VEASAAADGWRSTAKAVPMGDQKEKARKGPQDEEFCEQFSRLGEQNLN
jgi:hypothetical protein